MVPQFLRSRAGHVSACANLYQCCVTHAKMNHHILGTHGDVITEAQLNSLLDSVDEVVEEERVQLSKGGGQTEQTEQCEGAVSSSSSGSGNVEGW
jgi:hypothetical protein